MNRSIMEAAMPAPNSRPEARVRACADRDVPGVIAPHLPRSRVGLSMNRIRAAGQGRAAPPAGSAQGAIHSVDVLVICLGPAYGDSGDALRRSPQDSAARSFADPPPGP